MELSNETIEIAARIVQRHDAQQAARQAERRAAHAATVAAFNAQQRRLAGVGFVVIEVATGRAVGDGSPLPYGFARYIRDTRDAFAAGAFLVKRCSK